MTRMKQYTPLQIQEAWNDYIEYCKNYVVQVPTNKGIQSFNKPRVPTMDGFMVRLDIDRSTWSNYAKAPGYEDYFPTVKKINEIVLSGKLDALVNGEGNTTGLIFDLKANYGINETNFINNSGEVSVNVTYVDSTKRSNPE